jgi:chaperonin GroES
MRELPIYDRIIAKQITQEAKTKKSQRAEDASDKPLEVLVVSISKGKPVKGSTRPSLPIKAGDKLLVAKVACPQVKIDGVVHLILSEDDVLAIIEP